MASRAGVDVADITCPGVSWIGVVQLVLANQACRCPASIVVYCDAEAVPTNCCKNLVLFEHRASCIRDPHFAQSSTVIEVDGTLRASLIKQA